MPDNEAVKRYAYDVGAVDAVSDELGAAAQPAAYSSPARPVYEIDLPCAALPGARLRVILWPSLGRVDLRLLPAPGAPAVIAVTRKDVDAVEIYDGVEVTFRRRPAGFVFVTRGGTFALSD